MTIISKSEKMVNFGLAEKKIKNGAKSIKRLMSKNVHTRSYDPVTLFTLFIQLSKQINRNIYTHHDIQGF